MVSQLLFYRKLKNRVAAQTSRDRKKAKMETMEATLKEVMDKNEQVLEECENLKRMNQKLMEQNAELTRKLQEPCTGCSQNRLVDSVAQNRLGSAVSTDVCPLPKGVLAEQESAATLGQPQATAALLKIVLACLLYQTCSTNSTKTSTFSHLSSSLIASYKISPQIWKQLLQKQIQK